MRPIPLGIKELKTKGGRVRCLGPGKEHTFTSSDAVRVRVCFKCREKLRTAPAILFCGIETEPR
jgi:hypothetical protein